MQLETERLVLRMPRREDAKAVLALYSDPEAMRFIGGVQPEIVAEPEHLIELWLERWEANGFGHLLAERREDGAVVGRVGLVVWDTRSWAISTEPEAGEHGQPELGWALARAYWGYGYATEGGLAARDWAREEVGIDRLVSVIAPENERSQRVAAKLGAVPGETVELAASGPAVIWEYLP
jgi:RimJ/RimL family protein N-acetyltransferase